MEQLPQVRSRCKYTPEELTHHIVRNYKQGLTDLYALQGEYDGSCVIVNAGPSIDYKWAQVLKLCKGAKMPLLAISRMYPTLGWRGLKPGFVVSMDPSPDQEAGFTDIKPYTKHIMAACSNADIVAKLVREQAECYIFDSFTDPAVQDYRLKAGYRVATVINSGGSVSVAALGIAMQLGFKDLHIFGFDCMVPTPDVHHAASVSGESTVEQFFTLPLGTEEVTTCAPYVEFAQEAIDLLKAGMAAGLLKSWHCYGNSLINKLWDGGSHE
jgi:hypothetical protein